MSLGEGREVVDVGGEDEHPSSLGRRDGSDDRIDGLVAVGLGEDLAGDPAEASGAAPVPRRACSGLLVPVACAAR